MVGSLLFVGIWLNIVLFVFNFLPVYPLDGSKILEGILPRRHHYILEWMQQNSLLMMFLVLIVAIRFLHVPILKLTSLMIGLFDLQPYLGPVITFG
jgi:Zn-dependent protease